MEKYSVEVTLQAQEQMRDIALYVAKELMNRDAALGLLDAFEEAILSLEEFPERVALTSEEPWHSEKIHQLIVENYYVYFWIDGNVVRVTAVVYQRRDQRRQLENMDRRQENGCWLLLAPIIIFIK